MTDPRDSHLYDLAIFQPRNMVSNLSAWLEKAQAHAAERGYPADHLAVARLAPDQFSLTQQVQAAADQTKFLAARLAGVDAPKHPDVETTIDELRSRVAAVGEFLDGIQPEAIAESGDRSIELPYLPKPVTGWDYLLEFSLPNIYFHHSMAYAILRHNGVPLGKKDFIGSLRALQG